MREHDELPRLAAAIRDECLALRVRRLNRRITRIYDAALRPHGVSTAQLNVLVALAFAGDARATDIARALALEKSTLSRNVERMVGRGWIEVVRGERASEQRLRTLPEGRRLVEDALPAWRAAQREAIAAFPPELIEALRRGDRPGA
ncbi:MAG: winged helix-turn-helix transcriptional regulator [Gemmatimonadetes bacterium]|nr:winged helix-turn-helix transcriptional regulator [Gemmatimonadota bacterium]